MVPVDGSLARRILPNSTTQNWDSSAAGTIRSASKKGLGAIRGFRSFEAVIAYIRTRGRLETGPRHQQNCTDCHKENARPVRSEPQESHATPSRLQSVANRPGGIRAAKRSPPNSSACHVQDSAEKEQRAKPHQEHSRLSIHRCHAQQNRDSRQCTQICSGTPW